MSICSDDDDDGKWKIDLELAVLDTFDFITVREICKNRPFPEHLRKDIWQTYLKPTEVVARPESTFNNLGDIPKELLDICSARAERSLENIRLLSLRINSRNDDILEKVSNHSEDGLDYASQLDPSQRISSQDLAERFAKILMMYSQEYSKTFHADNGWLDILAVLYEVIQCSLNSELYAYFLVVQHQFIASGFLEDNRTCTVLRLLLQYHEPILCSLFECNKLSFETFSLRWFTTLFASNTQAKTTYALWDIYFLQSNPLLKIFIALVVLVNGKNHLLSLDDDLEDLPEDDDDEMLVKDIEFKSRIQLKNYEEGKLHRSITALLEPMEVSDLTSLLEIALSYWETTPKSFRNYYLELLFCNVDITTSKSLLSSAMCLHVTPEELINWHNSQSGQFEEANSVDLEMGDVPEVEFLPIDLRPPEEYNAGHLKSAYFLDAKLQIEDPVLFKKRIQVLFESQKKAKGRVGHIIFMGSAATINTGPNNEFTENISDVNMVIAYFLRLQIANISVLEGGYAALHEALGPMGVKDNFMSHTPEKCLVCLSSGCYKPNPLKMVSNAISRRTPIIQSAISSTTANDGLLKKFSSMFNAPANACLIQVTNRIPLMTSATSAGEEQCGKNAKETYRNTDSVFTIDDEDSDDDGGRSMEGATGNCQSENMPESRPSQGPVEGKDFPDRGPGGLDSAQLGDRIVVNNLDKRFELAGHFTCFYVNNESNKTGTGHLLMTQTFVLFLRDEKSLIGTQFAPLSLSSVSKQFKSWISTKVAYETSPEKSHSIQIERQCLVNKIPIEEIIRINTNRRIPEIISFIHGKSELISMGQQASRYRIYIPMAGEAVNLIKQLIYKNEAPTT